MARFFTTTGTAHFRDEIDWLDFNNTGVRLHTIAASAATGVITGSAFTVIPGNVKRADNLGVASRPCVLNFGEHPLRWDSASGLFGAPQPYELQDVILSDRYKDIITQGYTPVFQLFDDVLKVPLFFVRLNAHGVFSTNLPVTTNLITNTKGKSLRWFSNILANQQMPPSYLPSQAALQSRSLALDEKLTQLKNTYDPKNPGETLSRLLETLNTRL